MTAKGYDFFSGSQEDINRRLLRRILALEAKDLDNDKLEKLEKDLNKLSTIVGDSYRGLVHDVNEVYTDVALIKGIVGETDTDPLTVLGQLKTIFLDIGNDDLTSTIKGRIKVLESKVREENNG